MTSEESIKVLNELLFYSCCKADESVSMAKYWDKTVTAIDMAIAALREREGKDTNVPTKWISVDDEKPKRRGRYFIAYKFAGSDMHFYGEAMWHDDIPDNGYVQGDHFSNEGVNGMYVTHWMNIPKLPEPPEVEV